MIKKITTTLCLVFALISNIKSQNQFIYEWKHVFGINGISDQVNDVVYDKQGNVYHTGIQNITAGKVYVQKHSPTGTSLWLNNFQGTSGSFNTGTSLTIDTTGNVLVTGSFQNTLTITGSTPKPSNGSDDIFVAKFDNAGNHLWSFAIGGVADEQGLSITTDKNNNVYVTGFFNATMDFDPGVGTTTLTPVSNYDIFLAKYDANGNFLWVIKAGSTLGSNYAYGVATDNSNNVYITGHFFGTVDFNPSASTANLISNSSSADVFIAKYNGSGNYLNAIKIGGNNVDGAKNISVDTTGFVYITGSFSGVVDFNAGIGTNNLSSSATHGFLAKYDYNLAYQWAINIGDQSQGFNYALGLSTNVKNEIAVTGYFFDSLDVEPSSAVHNLYDNGFNGDIYTAVYSKTGTLLRAFDIGDSQPDNGLCVDIYNDKLAMGGLFSSFPDFDPSSATSTGNGGTSGYNGYVAQYGKPACNAPDVPIVIATQTNVCEGYSTTLSISSGNLNDAANWNWYATSCNGTAVGTGTSIVVTPTANTTYYVKGEGNCVTSSTCASIMINQTYANVGTDTKSACFQYTWINNVTYTASTSTASHTLTNINGCDSLVYLNLTINTVDTTVTQNGLILSSNANPSTSSYQWIDCNNANTPISGAVSQSYTASANGSYAVLVSSTTSSCVSTSKCYNIVTVGVSENKQSFFDLSPNPVNNYLHIRINNLTHGGFIKITSVSGQVIYSDAVYTNETQINTNDFSSGVYFVEIKTDNYIQTNRFIKD